MESLLTAQLNQEGVHVYIAKVRPFMKIKTDEGKEYYDLWFVLEDRGANRGSVLQARWSVKVVEGDVSTLRLQCMQWIG